jgi:ribosome-associated protein
MDNFNDSKALAIEIAKILDKKKAQDVRVLKVESLTVLTDYFVIASGTSTTQVASLADEVEYELSQKGLEPYSVEGHDTKNWVLLDYSNVIVHVFVPNSRAVVEIIHVFLPSVGTRLHTVCRALFSVVTVRCPLPDHRWSQRRKGRYRR